MSSDPGASDAPDADESRNALVSQLEATFVWFSPDGVFACPPGHLVMPACPPSCGNPLDGLVRLQDLSVDDLAGATEICAMIPDFLVESVTLEGRWLDDEASFVVSSVKTETPEND